MDAVLSADVSGISGEILTGGYWQYSHWPGPAISRFFRFMPDGSIANYDHPNERHWKIEDGILCLMNDQRGVTTRFTEIAMDGERVALSGPNLIDPSITLRLEREPGAWPQHTGTRALLADRIQNEGWEIGDHTYGLPNFVEDGLAKLRIGKYSSIGGDVLIAFGDHRTDMVSTYPFVTLGRNWLSIPPGRSDHRSRGDVSIGNDVWIGQGAFIGSGVTIGDGAVIGASAVVTRDVPPYAVFVGNPGRVVRFRFDETTIARLLGIAWWNWPDEVVDRHLPLMLSDDLEPFLAAAGARHPAA